MLYGHSKEVEGFAKSLENSMASPAVMGAMTRETC